LGWCASQQRACKLTLNIKDGVIEEALVVTIGCTGMTHPAAMASEILPGKTILEALNSEGGLQIGAGLEDLGNGLRSVIGTMYGTNLNGLRYLEMGLDKIIG